MEFSQHPGVMEAFREGFQIFRGDIETHLVQILKSYSLEDLPTINATSVTEKNMKKTNLPIATAGKLCRYLSSFFLRYGPFQLEMWGRDPSGKTWVRCLYKKPGADVQSHFFLWCDDESIGNFLGWKALQPPRWINPIEPLPPALVNDVSQISTILQPSSTTTVADDPDYEIVDEEDQDDEWVKLTDIDIRIETPSCGLA